MTFGSRLFVFVIFVALGLSFLATTATLAWEFWDNNRWVEFLAMDSHLFIFFATFAIIALVAFYLPSCAIVDIYWHHVKFGKLRFTLGFIVVLAASWLIACGILQGRNKPVWEIAPAVLLADQGEPAGCADTSGPCERLPLMRAIENLREVSQARSNLKVFVRKCRLDGLVAASAQTGPDRLCVASTPYTTSPPLQSDAECCKAQERLVKAVHTAHYGSNADPAPEMDHTLLLPLKILLWDAETSRMSLTAAVHALFLPFKVFFLLTLVAICLLLTFRFRTIEQKYAASLFKIEIGVLIGTFATLFFPLMSQAFLLSNEVLVGDFGYGNFSAIVPTMSFLFGVWTLLILLFFYRRRDKEVEIFGKISGAAAGIVALLQYETIVTFLVRTVGSGAHWSVIAALVTLAAIIAFITMWLIARPPEQDRVA